MQGARHFVERAFEEAKERLVHREANRLLFLP